MFTRVVAATRSNSLMVADGQSRWSPLVLTMFGQLNPANCSMLAVPHRWQNKAMNTEPPTARFADGESFAAARLSQTLPD